MIRLKNLDGLVHALRWNGKYLQCPESVSDHVWGMTALALEFYTLLPNELRSEVDIKDLIFRIAVHDIGESLYCDIPRTFKYHTQELGSLINQAEDDLIRSEYDAELADYIADAKSKSDPQGLLVALFDSIQAGLKMRSEVLLGNKFFETEIKNSYSMMDYYKKVFKDKVVGNDSPLYSVELLGFILGYIERYLEYLHDFSIQ